MVAKLIVRYNTRMVVATRPPDAPAIDEIIWEADEYSHTEKDRRWFWTVMAVAAGAIILCLLFRNVLFAIIILLGTGVLLAYAARPPERIRFSVSVHGLRAKHELYSFKHSRSFWIERGGSARVLLRTDRLFLPYIVFPIEGVDPEEIRRVLLRFLPEVEHHESLAELFAERIGF